MVCRFPSLAPTEKKTTTTTRKPLALSPLQKTQQSALQLACRHGHVGAAKALIACGADVNRAAPEGTPLAEAALGGSEELVRLLLERGADQAVGSPVSSLCLACLLRILVCCRLPLLRWVLFICAL